MELSIYTGQLRYRDVDFSFVFDGQELRLIPPEDKKHEIEFDWLMTNIGEGMYTLGNPLKMEEPLLTGKCSENGKTVIFLTKQNGYVGSRKEQWLTLLRARAIENQCFIAGINRVGYGGNVIYSGNSAVINPNGDIIAFGEDGTEDIIACDINPSDFKLDFITRNDRREDFYRQFY